MESGLSWGFMLLFWSTQAKMINYLQKPWGLGAWPERWCCAGSSGCLVESCLWSTEPPAHPAVNPWHSHAQTNTTVSAHGLWSDLKRTITKRRRLEESVHGALWHLTLKAAAVFTKPSTCTAFLKKNTSYYLFGHLRLLLSLLGSSRLHLYDRKYRKNQCWCEITQFKIKINDILITLNCSWFLWQQLYFQHHYSSLQCHMIFRNQYNMLICCSININYYYQCWKQFCCIIFLWKLILFQDSLMNKKVKKNNIIKNINILGQYKSLLSLFINLAYSCRIKVLISFTKKIQIKRKIVLQKTNFCTVLYVARKHSHF